MSQETVTHKQDLFDFWGQEVVKLTSGNWSGNRLQDVLEDNCQQMHETLNSGDII